MTRRLFFTLALLLGLVAFTPVFVAAQSASTTPARANLDARGERAKQKAAQEIERRVAALNRLEERIAAMRRVSETFKTDLGTTIDAEMAKLEALRARIAASTNAEELKTDVQLITRSYRIFALVMPKAAIAAAADKIVRMSATLSEIGTKLKTRVDAASAEKNVSELSAMLTDLAAKITSANNHAQTAVNGTSALVPDEGDKVKMEANKKALEAARLELKSAHEDIKAARELVRKIIDGLKQI